MATVTLGDSAATVRSGLGIGSAATLNTGTGANNVVALDGSGNLPAIDASAVTGRTAGKTLQIITDTSNTQTIFTNTTYADTEFTINITPSNASHKVMLSFTCIVMQTGGNLAANVRIMRDSTDISGNCQLEGAGQTMILPYNMQFLDSPNTTSQITYKVQMYAQSGSSCRRNFDGSYGQFTAMEVNLT